MVFDNKQATFALISYTKYQYPESPYLNVTMYVYVYVYIYLSDLACHGAGTVCIFNTEWLGGVKLRTLIRQSWIGLQITCY